MLDDMTDQELGELVASIRTLDEYHMATDAEILAKLLAHQMLRHGNCRLQATAEAPPSFLKKSLLVMPLSVV